MLIFDEDWAADSPIALPTSAGSLRDLLMPCSCHALLPLRSRNRISESREPRLISPPGLLSWECLGVSEGIRTPDIQDHNLAL